MTLVWLVNSWWECYNFHFCLKKYYSAYFQVYNLLIFTSQGSIFSSLGGLTFIVSNSGSCVIGSEFWQISSSVAFEALGSDSTELKAIRWRSDSLTSSAPDSFNSRECTRIPYLICIWKKQNLTLTRPIGLPPHAPVAQKIADQRWLIANLAKKVRFLYKMMWLKVG